MNFELDLDTNVNFSCSSTSLSWTDAKGQPQTLTVNKGFTKVVATSLPAGGTISWNTPSGATHVGFWWVLQRGQAMGASSNFAEYGQCGTSGSLYSNLTDRPLELDFSVSGPTTCEATFSWTDAAGHAQNLDAGRNTTEGVSTTLSAGGTISWTATAGGADAFTSFVEQVPVTGSAGD
ncbi:MAG TPA: hypothetical protein VG028_10215 [Terriglobia bacterium]|nr:hypothetical protein [Terriglobia bacterium]